METRSISTPGSCIWPANSKLCCAHIQTIKGEPSFGVVINSVTNHTNVDISTVRAGTTDGK